MRVAIAQIRPSLGDVPRNLASHGEWIRRARAGKARAIVFPELSLTGYLLQDLAQDLAMDPAAAPELRKIAAWSRDLSILVGLVERTAELRYHNSAVLFEGGKPIHRHRKVYLPTYGMFDEGRYFAPGDRFRVRETSLGMLGLAICEDAWHLSSSYLLAQGGADVICITSAGPVRGMRSRRELQSRSAWRDLCRVIAQFFTVHVLYCNRVGSEEGWSFRGGSFVVDPLGEILAEAGERDEELLMVDLRPERLREARTFYPLLRDERAHLTSRELGRLLQRRAEAEP